MRKYREYTNEDVVEAAKTSFSLAEVLKKLGLLSAGGNFNNLKRKLARLNIDTSHFTGQSWNKGKTLKEWAEYKNDSGRKKVLISERGHKCEDCGLTEWKEYLIVLEIHHVDGDRMNNEKENLQLLCCNCHATTDNWRNKKRPHGEIGKPNEFKPRRESL